jgi:hypothetical protein
VQPAFEVPGIVLLEDPLEARQVAAKAVRIRDELDLVLDLHRSRL